MTQRCSSMVNNASANDFSDSAVKEGNYMLSNAGSLSYSQITYHDFFLGTFFTNDLKLNIFYVVSK